MQLREEFIRSAIDRGTILYKNFPNEAAFSIDIETVRVGDIFVALQDKTNDTHVFIKEAFDKGAAGCIVQEDHQDCLKDFDINFLAKKLVIVVPDTLAALVALASKWREQFNYPVVAITGSTDKTSTQKMLMRICGAHGFTFNSFTDSKNGIASVAASVLGMRAEHSIAIFKLSISKRGEMAKMAKLVRPTVAVITTVGHSHMEGLGSIVDIAAEKRDIFKYFKEHNIGIVCGDQPLLAQVAYQHPVIKFGCKTTNQIQARKISRTSAGTSFVLKVYKEKFTINMADQHTSAVFNALAAVAVTYMLKIPLSTIMASIAEPLVVEGKFEEKVLKFGVGRLINDAYDANPEDMKAALSAFQLIETDAVKIAILGDMLGLGINAPFWHRQIGRFLRKTPSVRKVILVGSMVKWIHKTMPLGVQVEVAPSWQVALDMVKNNLQQKALVLVKGSFSVGLTHLVDALV